MFGYDGLKPLRYFQLQTCCKVTFVGVVAVGIGSCLPPRAHTLCVLVFGSANPCGFQSTRWPAPQSASPRKDSANTSCEWQHCRESPVGVCWKRKERGIIVRTTRRLAAHFRRHSLTFECFLEAHTVRRQLLTTSKRRLDLTACVRAANLSIRTP